MSMRTCVIVTGQFSEVSPLFLHVGPRIISPIFTSATEIPTLGHPVLLPEPPYHPHPELHPHDISPQSSLPTEYMVVILDTVSLH